LTTTRQELGSEANDALASQYSPWRFAATKRIKGFGPSADFVFLGTYRDREEHRELDGSLGG